MLARTLLVAALAVAAVSAEPLSDTYSAILLGDWGGTDHAPYTEPGQVACAGGISKVVSDISAQSVYLLGDNFYTTGIQGSQYSPRFKETFEDVYTAQNLQDIPFYVVAGNHDHKGNVSAQIAYSTMSKRWTQPDYYYLKTFKPADGSFSIDVVFIDTVLLAGNSDDLEDKFGPLPGPRDEALAATQWSFIEDALKNSKADYLFAAGHYPVWSGCSHGPTGILVATLKPMLEKYNATGYFSGHDHCLEFIKEDTSDVNYYLTGAGDNCCYANSNVDKCPEKSIKFAVWDDGHGAPMIGGFGSYVATKEGFTVNFHAANGTTLYTAPTVAPRKF